VPTASRQIGPPHALNVILDDSAALDIVLPSGLEPSLPAVNGSSGVSQFYLLDDGKTGVLALGSFSAPTFDGLQQSLLTGLVGLKNRGATRLIVDLTNNSGGKLVPRQFRYQTNY
jgi:hypothetical protein